MFYKLTSPVLVLFVLFSTSCTKEIPIDIDENETLIVCNSIIETNKDMIVVLNQSRHILEQNGLYPTIENATVQITDNENNR